MKILCQFYHVSYYFVCAISFSPSHSASSPVAGPGARKPSVGEGKESSQPLVCSTLVYFLFFSFFFISAPILACEIIIIKKNNNNNSGGSMWRSQEEKLLIQHYAHLVQLLLHPA